MCVQIVQGSRTSPAKIQSNAAVTEGQARKSAHSGRIISSMCALSCSKKAVPYRDNSSAGLQSLGTHSIHTLHLSTMHMACQAVERVWMPLDLLQPFVKAQQTLWLSMKRMISRPAMSAANVLRNPADAKSSNGIICACRGANALHMCSGVSSAHPLRIPSAKMHPPRPLSKARGG